MNRLYFGDNLKWLSDRREFPDGSVDLVYLDPPFNSNADYNVLFREASGQVSQAQFHAFTDTWTWADAADIYHQFIDNCPNVAVVEMMEAFHSFLKNSPMMAYLAMMAPRLVELRRVLKETGSLYLHCDPTASHHLKLMLDAIFGAQTFGAKSYGSERVRIRRPTDGTTSMTYYETERKDFLNRVREDAPSMRTEPVHREKIIVQVKGGGVNRGDVATLLGDVENQKAAGGVLITLEKPSRQMREEANDAGHYSSKLWHDKDYPHIQILTVEGLLNGAERVSAPPQLNPFAMAAREATREKQAELL
jgi:hypothetical protein